MTQYFYRRWSRMLKHCMLNFIRSNCIALLEWFLGWRYNSYRYISGNLPDAVCMFTDRVPTCNVQLPSFCRNSTNLGTIPVRITSSIGGLGSKTKTWFNSIIKSSTIIYGIEQTSSQFWSSFDLDLNPFSLMTTTSVVSVVGFRFSVCICSDVYCVQWDDCTKVCINTYSKLHNVLKIQYFTSGK